MQGMYKLIMVLVCKAVTSIQLPCTNFYNQHGRKRIDLPCYMKHQMHQKRLLFTNQEEYIMMGIKHSDNIYYMNYIIVGQECT